MKNATLHIGNGEVLQGDMKIEEGKIIEIGNYEELMAKKGAFYKLQTLQS